MIESPPIAQEGEPRCSHMISGKHQCRLLAVKVGSNCVIHGGRSILEAIRKEDSIYKLKEQYRSRVDELTDHKKHFSLNEEIGVLRLLLETMFSKIDDDSSLLRSSGAMSELITKIEKLVNSAMRAEKYVGGLMSRNQAIQMIQDVVDVLAAEIDDPDLLGRVADKFQTIVRKDYIDTEDKK